jgi:hypothetical protein
MTVRLRRSALAVVAVGVGLACEPIVGDPGPAVPINACPAHPCSAYQQPGATPSCNAGVCTVTAPTTDLLLIIGLATDSYLAPGRTYMTTLNGTPSASGTCAPLDSCALPDCSPPLCALPEQTIDQSSYLIDPNEAQLEAHWYLGKNMGTTTLPVQATFRRLFATAPDATPQDAFDLGLPVEPVQAVNFTTEPGTPGPNDTAQQNFETYLPPGCYERTLQPFSPFSTAFPPEIKPWPPDQMVACDFDATREETLANGASATYPTFDIARAEGLGGWTAYLRDIQTKRIFSNVAPLTGSLAQNVILVTNHNPAPPAPVCKQSAQSTFEALTDLELVLAPPAGTPLPTEVFAPAGAPPSQELAGSEEYPSLPTPVTVTGRIQTPAGTPVPANVYFTATDISDRSGQPFPPNFEFATSVSTTTDPHTGASTYSALLPQGDYVITVRPTDSSSAIRSVPRAVGGQGNVMTGEDIDVLPLVSVSGIATVADRRPLAEAVAEVLPTQCAPDASMGITPDTSYSCLPRAVQTGTGTDGSFALQVDPGQYLLRIRPRQGSQLPWKIEALVVGPTDQGLGSIAIPAPISVGMRLTDCVNNPIVNALVRVFTDPSQGTPPVELGEAITDGQGNYAMYIDPTHP